MTMGFFLTAFVLSVLASRRSLRAGLLSVLAVGYAYGILRANFPDWWTYLTFDAAVLGLFAVQLWQPLTSFQRGRLHDLRLWVVALIAWPTLLFLLFAASAPWIELVGLRANVFLLSFLLIGGRLTDDDVLWIAGGLSWLNIGVVAVGVAEFFVGIEPFYPKNEVTELIYRSKDLVGWTAHRIPATFSSAHAFAGTMVMTLPFIIAGWVHPDISKARVRLLGLAVIASLLGIFMAAARTHIITAALLGIVVTFTRGLKAGQRLRWVVVVGLVAYVVAGEERLQRFTSLQDTDAMATRWSESVHEGFFDLLVTNPLGRGLTGGGTSVPHFLESDTFDSRTEIENEYARISLEQGLPGLALWVLFLLWIFGHVPRRATPHWLLARRLAWLASAAAFVAGLTGIGLLSSVPQTVLMLTMMGWFVTAPERDLVLNGIGTLSAARPQPVGLAAAGVLPRASRASPVSTKASR